jgi:hypothetical protein
MAVQNFLEESSVEQLINKYNFIIPEIQREYVWGNNDFNILDKFFNDIKEATKEGSSDEEAALQMKSLEKMLEKADDKDKENIKKLIDTYLSKKDLNIGFLYSYKPDYYIYNDRNDDVYLIDGQQRFTTLILALFYFALKENVNYIEFKSFLRFNEKLEKLAFDYRVRTITHNFLIELVANCNTIEDLIGIKEKTWFLTDFAGDVTVKAMLGTINKLQEHFKDDNNNYYQFVKKQIRFWHFKTEETSQGEELYITMNSRGQQLADHETVRAKLFENEKIKTQQIEWGAKWEKWQDFFWKNKSKGENADNGLNQFLRWVNIAEFISTENFKTRELAEKEYKKLISENHVLETVSLIEIEPYFNSLELLKTYYNEGFFSSSHFSKNFLAEWLTGNLSQVDLIKLLPALMFLKDKKPKEELNRFIRFFSNITNHTGISKNPDTYIVESIQLTKLFLDKGFSDVTDLILLKDTSKGILTSEEVCKLSLFKKETNPAIRQNLEEAFWNTEDFKFSNGKIGHLLQMCDYNDDKESFSYNSSFDYKTILNIDLKMFQEIFASYTELINQENEMWGDLIDTSVYYKENERVYANGNWHLNSGFLNLVFERKENKNIDFIEFLILKEKEFILKYANENEIQTEINPKKQLYIYYILHKRILKKWGWDKWNFGFYEGNDYPNVSSIFESNKIYQIYNSQWRYNIGYIEKDGIWLQDNFDSNRNYIAELINWAKI